jgi:hypothetical protein
MYGTRTKTAALLFAATALLTSVGMASPAQAAVASTTSVASPAHALAWYIKRVYATSAACRAAGQAYVDTDFAKDYKCLYDSPGIALWLNSY